MFSFDGYRNTDHGAVDSPIWDNAVHMLSAGIKEGKVMEKIVEPDSIKRIDIHSECF